MTGQNDTRIPVTLLTGFLGSGKTTLLNHLIRDPQAGRVAVIMNEFGDIGLDHDLIEEATEETILMESGCLCCSIRGDLVKTLSSLLGRRSRGDLEFDRVVIETTGIADPGPILHSLVTDQIAGPNFRMDGVVVLADAATGLVTFDKQFEAVQQIAMADLIILSKTDLVTPHDLRRFKQRLTTINHTAQQIEANQGAVPSGVLFGLSAMRANVTPVDVSNWLGTAPNKPDPFADLSGLMPKPSQATPQTTIGVTPKSHNEHRINSASIAVDDPIPADVFDFWLDTLIALKGPNILRMKGIVHVEGMDWPFVFHGVQHIFDAPVPLTSWNGPDTTSRVVVIARDIDAADLAANLETLRMKPQECDKPTSGMMTDTI